MFRSTRRRIRNEILKHLNPDLSRCNVEIAAFLNESDAEEIKVNFTGDWLLINDADDVKIGIGIGIPSKDLNTGAYIEIPVPVLRQLLAIVDAHF